MEKGVIYMVSGEKYIKEVRRSASSVKKHMPNISITVFTGDDFNDENIDDVRLMEGFSGDYGDSVIRPGLSPYNKSLFLDSDTYLCDSISEIFTLLDRFDLAAAHNPMRRAELSTQEYAHRLDEEVVPDCFPQYNTGVIAFNNNNAEVEDTFSQWNEYYQNAQNKKGYRFNQPSFRRALYESDVRIATLTPEYNCRINNIGYVHGEVKILHGRHPKMESVTNIINDNTELKRIHTRDKWPLKIKSDKRSYRYRIFHSIHARGVLGTFRKVFDRFIDK